MPSRKHERRKAAKMRSYNRWPGNAEATRMCAVLRILGNPADKRFAQVWMNEMSNTQRKRVYPDLVALHNRVVGNKHPKWVRNYLRNHGHMNREGE